MGQRGIDLVGKLRCWSGVVVKVDEELPVDGPAGRDGTKSPQIITVVAEDRTLDLRVELVPRTDHGMPEAVGGHRKLHGHEFQVILLEPGYRRDETEGIREDALVCPLVQDCGQEGLDQDPLVMPSDLVAGILEADVLARLA